MGVSSHEHPIELPQLRHSPDAATVETLAGSGKQADRVLAWDTKTDRDKTSDLDSDRLVLKGRTLWDETILVLTRALDRATSSEERMVILDELKAWRKGRP